MTAADGLAKWTVELPMHMPSTATRGCSNNDYGIETVNPKSNAVLAMVTDLLSRNVPIHGVGFQFHVDATAAPGFDAIVQNFRRFTALGLAVNISELDVRVANVVGTRVKRPTIRFPSTPATRASRPTTAWSTASPACRWTIRGCLRT